MLWGPPELRARLWPGAEHAPIPSRPTRLSGQRDLFAVPRADLVVFLHQQRPLRRVPALTAILDTTPLRYNRNRLDRWAKARFLRRVGRISKGILTISDFSRTCIERDLGVPPERIIRLSLPADRELAGRVLAQRQRCTRDEVALYVGLFLPHKNLPRLIEAFGRTRFRQRGGRLLLVGGKHRADPLRQTLDQGQRSYVTIREHCDQAELEGLYATSRFLVQPSLEEGFGLPVQEALAAGLPVCASHAGALPEVTLGFAELFDPTSVTAITAAIDRTADRPLDDGHKLSIAYLAQAPTIDDLARQVLAAVSQALA